VLLFFPWVVAQLSACLQRLESLGPPSFLCSGGKIPSWFLVPVSFVVFRLAPLFATPFSKTIFFFFPPQLRPLQGPPFFPFETLKSFFFFRSLFFSADAGVQLWSPFLPHLFFPSSAVFRNGLFPANCRKHLRPPLVVR